jgi:xylose isomerase
VKLKSFVFWGGRGGYMSLLNTDMGRELDTWDNFLRTAFDYGRAQRFKDFLIEPKPMEPTKHQYNFVYNCNTSFLCSRIRKKTSKSI